MPVADHFPQRHHGDLHCPAYRTVWPCPYIRARDAREEQLLTESRKARNV